MTATRRVVAGTVLGAAAGFLTRPCCVVPAALSVAGVGSAGLAHATIASRPAFLSISAAALLASLWLTFRREGAWFTKAVAAAATFVAFALSAAFMGV